MARTWTTARSSPSRPEDPLPPQEIAELIRQLHAIDPRGDGIRYTVNTRGQYTLQGLQEIDIEHTDTICRRISTMLYWANLEVRRIVASVDRALTWTADGKLTFQDQVAIPPVADET
jgi:hypothetical protein